MEQMNEGYHAVGKTKSYNDSIPETKIIIQHSKVMEEGEQRFRHVEKIFIENALGERMLAPTTKPGIAKVYARHIAEGGLPHDERWKHISNVCEEYTKMAGFVRATRSNQFNESAQKLVESGINHYIHLRETLHKMIGKKGYNAYFESWTPPLMENEEQVDLSEMFMTSSLDPRIESVMPILGKLSKNLSETKLKEVDEFAAWAARVIEADEGIVSSNPQGMPESELDDVEEGLDANQKQAGQLGPTEKVGPKGAVGKLVGANESVELSETDSEGKATPTKTGKAKKDFAKMFQKNIDKSNKEKKDTEEKVKQHQEVTEGQEDLDAILRIIKK